MIGHTGKRRVSAAQNLPKFQRVAADQTGTSMKCRSRGLRAPAIRYRSKFALRRHAENGLNKVRRLRDDVICALWRQMRSIKDVSLIPAAYGAKTGAARFGVRQAINGSQQNYAVSRPRFDGRSQPAVRSMNMPRVTGFQTPTGCRRRC